MIRQPPYTCCCNVVHVSFLKLSNSSIAFKKGFVKDDKSLAERSMIVCFYGKISQTPKILWAGLIGQLLEMGMIRQSPYTCCVMLYHFLKYSKSCVTRPFKKKRQNKGLNDNW